MLEPGENIKRAYHIILNSLPHNQHRPLCRLFRPMFRSESVVDCLFDWRNVARLAVDTFSMKPDARLAEAIQLLI